MELSEINPFPRTTGYFPKWKFENRYKCVAYDLRVFAFLNSSALVTLNDRKTELPAESLLILAPGEPEKIACPVLLFTAEHDFSVLPAPQEAFISRVPVGKRVFVKDARHEIYRSVNAVFFPWWNQVLAFFREEGVLKA